MTVLTTGFWPTYKFTELALPLRDGQVRGDVQDVLRGANQTPQADVIYALGTLAVKGSPPLPIEMHISPFQASCLLLFNREDTLSYKEIAERLNLPDEDVRRTLHSLACSKYKILKKSPEGAPSPRATCFRTTTRCRSPAAHQGSGASVEDRKKVLQDVDNDRRYAIDAAIVRTMKSRKTLAHQKLVLEVVQQLSKGSSRISKSSRSASRPRHAEFLERDKEDPTVFNYLA